MKQSRTHNCGELRLADAGKNFTIVGWLENVREVGTNEQGDTAVNFGARND